MQYSAQNERILRLCVYKRIIIPRWGLFFPFASVYAVSYMTVIYIRVYMLRVYCFMFTGS